MPNNFAIYASIELKKNFSVHYRYQWLAKRLSSDHPGPGANLKIICETMPDPYKARAKYWIPFIKSKLQDVEKVYVVGHSSGAVAIMRLW